MTRKKKVTFYSSFYQFDPQLYFSKIEGFFLPQKGATIELVMLHWNLSEQTVSFERKKCVNHGACIYTRMGNWLCKSEL